MDTKHQLNSFVEDYEQDENPEMVPVHISWEEVRYFNFLQGGQIVDEETGLRSYPKLSAIIRKPEIRDLFIQFGDMLKKNGKFPSHLMKKLEDFDHKNKLHGVPPIPSDEDPKVDAMAEIGEGTDKALVMLPEDVEHFFDILQGGARKDSYLKLEEFFGFTEIAGLVAMAAGAMMSESAAEDEYRQDMEDWEDSNKRHEGTGKFGNFNEPLFHVSRGYVPLKTGGHIGEPIKGPGRGQDDVIKRDRIKEGGWIWDATTTGHLGDGATDAGQKHIEKFEKIIKKHKLGGSIHKAPELDGGRKPRNVPCALSNGERYTPPKLVTALGDGSNAKGAKILRNLTKEIRLHKVSKGAELPPPAHDLTTYYKKVVSDA